MISKRSNQITSTDLDHTNRIFKLSSSLIKIITLYVLLLGPKVQPFRFFLSHFRGGDWRILRPCPLGSWVPSPLCPTYQNGSSSGVPGQHSALDSSGDRRGSTEDAQSTLTVTSTRVSGPLYEYEKGNKKTGVLFVETNSVNSLEEVKPLNTVVFL